jgi:hypothetical protein
VTARTSREAFAQLHKHVDATDRALVVDIAGQKYSGWLTAKDPSGLVSQCFISVVAAVYGVVGTASSFTGGAAAVLAAPAS